MRFLVVVVVFRNEDVLLFEPRGAVLRHHRADVDAGDRECDDSNQTENVESFRFRMKSTSIRVRPAPQRRSGKRQKGGNETTSFSRSRHFAEGNAR